MLTDVELAAVVTFARSEVGTRYSKREAFRVVVPGPKPRTRQQFCSRFVARAFQQVGVILAEDPDYCTPDELRQSPLLIEISDITEEVSEAERLAWASRPNPILATQIATNKVLDFARTLDADIESFSDLDQAVQLHPEWDDDIAKVFRESGYLDLWKIDFEVNPWHYSLDEMAKMNRPDRMEDLRGYAIDTIKEFHSGNWRYACNVLHYEAMHKANGRTTDAQLLALYKLLTRNDEKRRNVALSWLKQFYPQEVKKNIERVEPHTDIWFSIVDRVEPRLAAIARTSISCTGSVYICSSCGDDPTNDYFLLNAAEAMPGVPMLRLCDDCVAIRRNYGEKLESI
ncbi:hypothetical protein MMA231_02556 [Asticcacaulis sp. MM231]